MVRGEINRLFLCFSLAKDIYPYPYLIDYTGIPFIAFWKPVAHFCVWTANNMKKETFILKHVCTVWH